MPSYSKLRQRLEADLKRRLGELGFIKQRKDYKDYYVKRTPEGNHAVECKIDARHDVSLCLRFHLRFEAVSHAMQLISEETRRRGLCAVRIDPQTEAYYQTIGPDFECFYERLVGLTDWTADTIEDEEELDTLCERTLQRVHDYGMPFFNKYGTLAAVFRVVETDSADWALLAITRGEFLVTGAATMLAVRGRGAMLEYVKKHDADPDLIGWHRDRVDMLIAASDPQRKKP